MFMQNIPVSKQKKFVKFLINLHFIFTLTRKIIIREVYIMKLLFRTHNSNLPHE